MQHSNELANSRTLDAIIAMSLARPDRNISGAVGPRCPTCSGLGAVLRMGSPMAPTKATSRCGCDGSGLDLGLIERVDRELLWAQIHKLEQHLSLSPTSRYDLLQQFENSRQTWMETVAWQTADGTAVASSTTETIVFPNITIPANYMADGRTISGILRGKYSTLGSGTVSHVYKLRWGGVAGTLLCGTGTVTLLVSLTNCLFEIEFEIQTRTNDTTGGIGVLIANGKSISYGGTAPTIGSATGAPAVSPMTNGGQSGPAQVGSLTLNADTALSVTLTHGANNAANTATGQQFTLESKN